MVVQGRIRRLVLVALALLLVCLFARVAMAQMLPTPEVCKKTTSSDWEWWANWCWNYPSSSLMPTPFVIR